MAKKIATREAYGKALAALANENKNIVVLDADLSKSTKTADFKKSMSRKIHKYGYCRRKYDVSSSRFINLWKNSIS